MPTSEGNTVKIWSLTEFDGLDAVRARFVDHRFPPHFHDSYVIGVTERGAEEVFARGESGMATPGCIRLINPGEVHAGGAARDTVWHYRALYPSERTLRAVAMEVVGRDAAPGFAHAVTRDADLARQLLALIDLLEASRDRLRREVATVTVLAAIVARHGGDRTLPSPRGGNAGVARAAEFIRDNLTGEFGLADLAEVAGLSPFHLIRVFRREFGLTPFAYQAQLRVLAAQRDLRGASPIADIAALHGFSDQSHFTRVFKGVTGTTPFAYRRAMATPRATHGAVGRA